MDTSLHGLIDKVCEQQKKNHSLPTESLVMRLLHQAAREAKVALARTSKAA